MATLKANDLEYKFPESLTVVKNRTQHRQYFTTKSFNYDDKYMECVWKTGNGFINPKKSFLCFDLKSNATETFTFGSTESASPEGGLATSIFKSIRIKHRLGKILNECRASNRWTWIKFVYQMSRDWRDSVGSGMELGAGELIGAVSPRRFCVPLYLLDSFFVPKGDSHLIPPQMANGLTLTFSLEEPSKCLDSGATGYNISNIYFMLDRSELEIEGSSKVSSEAFKRGLSYSYTKVYSQEEYIPIAGAFTSDVEEACSFCEKVYVQPVAPTSGVGFEKSRPTSANTKFRYQFNHGDRQYPYMPTEDFREQFQSNLECFDLEHGKTSIRYTPQWVTTDQLYAVSLERSELPLSGLAVNGDRIMRFSVQSTDTTTFPVTRYVTFMEYSAVATASLENITIVL